VAVLTAVGCGYYRSPADRLRMSVGDYNDAVRWHYWKVAAQYIPPERRAEFIERREAEGDNMRITEYEIRSVSHDEARQEAHVIVEFTWHRYPSLSLRHTRMRQTWSFATGDWRMMAQEEVHVEDSERRPEDMF